MFITNLFQIPYENITDIVQMDAYNCTKFVILTYLTFFLQKPNINFLLGGSIW
jgi:hypothetical protein